LTIKEIKFYAVEKRSKSKSVDIHTNACPIFKNRKSDRTNTKTWHYPYDNYQEALQIVTENYPEYSLRDCAFCNPNPREFDFSIAREITIDGMALNLVWNSCMAWLLHIGASIRKSENYQSLVAYHRISKSGRDIYYVINLEFSSENQRVKINVNISPHPRPEYRIRGLKKLVEKPWSEQIDSLEDFIKKSEVKLELSEVHLFENIRDAFSNLYRPREPLFTVSNVVYQKMPKPRVVESGMFIIISIILFIGFYVLYFWFNPSPLINNILFFLTTYGVAVLFLYWVYRSDKYEKEPLTMVLVVFAWGVFSGAIVAPLNRMFGPYFEIIGTYSLVAAFVEEPVKAIGLYLLVNNKRYGKEFNTPLDGIVYGFATGIGFFAMENFFYFLKYGASNLIVRSIYCWGHGVYVATVGLWLAVSKCKRGRISFTDIFPGLLVAISMHFLWNGWGAWIGKYAGDIIHIQALFQFGYLVKIIREGLRDEMLWGYSLGRAPE